MFEHVMMFLSFVFALALTHLLTTWTELLLARDRVRFSGLHALWTVNAIAILLSDWLGLWGLSIIKHWTLLEVSIQFAVAIGNYFMCSTLRINTGEQGVVDVPAIFEKQRPVIMASLIALAAVALFENYWDRNNAIGFNSNDWIRLDLSILPAFLILGIAGLARPLWLQWAAGFTMTALLAFLLIQFPIPG